MAILRQLLKLCVGHDCDLSQYSVRVFCLGVVTIPPRLNLECVLQDKLDLNNTLHHIHLMQPLFFLVPMRSPFHNSPPLIAVRPSSLLIDTLHFEAETMPSTLCRNAMLIHIIDSAFNNHASFELLVEAYEDKTEEGGHANGYKSGDAVNAHGNNITRTARGIHCLRVSWHLRYGIEVLAGN